MRVAVVAARAALRRRGFSSAAAPLSGTLYICGTGESNKLGVGDTRDRETPTLVEALQDVPITHVSCGKYHTAALSADGDVYAWGLESSGQLGLGSSRTKAPTPQKVDALSGRGITQLSCGLYHTAALTADGEVLTCGFGGSFFNGAGALGHGDRAQLEEPKVVAAFGPSSTSGLRAASVSSGGYHSIALDVDGGVWSWGRGEWGRLGHSDAADCLEPTRIEECDHVATPVRIALAGDAHSGCLSADGVAYTWGRNEHWQLGYEVVGLLNAGQSLDAQQEPLAVPMTHLAPSGAEGSAEGEQPTQPTLRTLSLGELGTAAIDEDGQIYVWGMGRFFEPTRVPEVKDKIEGGIVDLQVGAYHIAVLTDEGRLYTYGTGTALGLPKVARKSWEIGEVTAHSLEGQRVVSMACGPYSTAVVATPR